MKLTKYSIAVILLALILFTSTLVIVYDYYLVKRPAHLRILYTHSPEMVKEVVSDFEAQYQNKYGRAIEVTITLTSPETAFEKARASWKDPEADIWWGGPPTLFEDAKSGLLAYNSTSKNNNETCYFCPLMDMDKSKPWPQWYATSLYGIGVMYNEEALNSLGLPKPETWKDFLKEEYGTNVTMLDPANSEFSSSFIMLVLQSQSWIAGWEYLVKLSASIKEYDPEEDYSILKVSSGYVPLAIVPDFYAYDRMASEAPFISFTYLDGTILQPDPIAIFERASYKEEAKAFMDYIIDHRAQDIVGEYLLPIRDDVEVSPPKINPFDPSFPHIENFNETFQEVAKEIVENYYSAWITEKHEEIRTVWENVVDINKTKGNNPIADDYYKLAWGNFTYLSRYLNRSGVDIVYNVTDGWTKTDNTTLYLNEWRGNSTSAYDDALENLEKAKQAVGPSIPFVALYPYNYNNMTSLNYTYFLNDLDKVTELGFKGVKLHNVESFYDEGILEQVMDALEGLDLKVIVSIQFFDRTFGFNASQTPAMPPKAWDVSGFPDNSTQVEAFLDYVKNVTQIVWNKASLFSYSVSYPFDPTNETTKAEWMEKITSDNYNEALQSIVEMIRYYDTIHPIHLVPDLGWLEQNPLSIYDKLPYTFEGIEGYGFQAYSTAINDINEEAILQLYNLFSDKGEEVYIDRWGFHTTEADFYGRAGNEDIKSQMIRDFVQYIHNWKIVFCYFGLHDFPLLSADYGLIDINQQLKPSGEAMKEVLQSL